MRVHGDFSKKYGETTDIANQHISFGDHLRLPKMGGGGVIRCNGGLGVATNASGGQIPQVLLGHELNGETMRKSHITSTLPQLIP